ncbi:MAG: HD domain-containing protein [Thermofilum sp.]|jgi:CRISPR/Cas system-associated endonuclease Cas3-HD|uniref:HD domain-containing protein n=1 Tax=Thermofilum sp. TaxID=1961369 RepID=UPI002587A740|nr:HD domain-containing protein [Thermofilum sp.]MCI4409013.1 HD domain-containing protein [Thermofilum sp.]
MCYAYRKPPIEETLHKHSLEVAQCIKNSWEFIGLKRKIWRLYGIDEETAGDLVLIAGLLHDLGKAEKETQEKCMTECTDFPHHYVTSAMIALRIGYNTIDLDLSPDNIEDTLNQLLAGKNTQLEARHIFLALVVLPVLLHHYSQITSEYSVLKPIRPTISIGDECLKQINTLTNDAKQFIKTPLASKILDTTAKTLNKNPIDLGVLPNLRNNLLRIGTYKTENILIEATTGILNKCDGQTASKNRKNKHTQETK